MGNFESTNVMGEKLESIVLASLKLENFHLSWKVRIEVGQFWVLSYQKFPTSGQFSNFIFTNDISNFPT